jgi:hypothetical protein
MKMYVVMLVWTGLRALQASPATEPVFENPSAKGSLIRLDSPDIPYEFQGVWADRLENCYLAGDRGVQASISAGAIGADRAVKVEGYSDHPAILVTLRQRRGGTRQLALDVTRDGKTLRLEEPTRDRSDLLVRCPPPPSGYTPPNPDVRDVALEADHACKAGDFARLFAAITRSPFVQRRFFAPRIVVRDSTGARQVTGREFGSLPVRHDDFGYRLTVGSDAYTEVSVEFREAEDGQIEVLWFPRYPVGRESEGASPDRLMFRKGGRCWELSAYIISASRHA